MAYKKKVKRKNVKGSYTQNNQEDEYTINKYWEYFSASMFICRKKNKYAEESYAENLIDEYLDD